MFYIFHRHSPARVIAMIAAGISIYCPISPAHAETIIRAPNGEPFKERFERLKKEIGQLSADLQQSQKNIQSLKETNNCIHSAYQSLSGLTEQLQSLGRRTDKNSFAFRSGQLAAKHNSFFDSLDEFSKTELTLVQNPDGTTAADKNQLDLLLERIPLSIRQLRSEFEKQTGEEEVYLRELSFQLVNLQKAISQVKRNEDGIRKCTPQLTDVAQKLVHEGGEASVSLSLSRKLFGELQNKRARVLGAFNYAMQQKISAALAQASGQTANSLIERITLSLEELRLRTEAERWWFKEALQDGPARGFLSGKNADPVKADQNLRLAIAGCDVLLGQLQLHKRTLSPADSNTASPAISDLEQSLYQRRKALTQWLGQVNLSINTVAK
ncbi:MAG: hypothetical protein EBR09_05920 [Proteobacteria bacterium]|nr:hypothetical protein [Pseudomonadota bacterium]